MSDAVKAYQMMVVDRTAKVDYRPTGAGDLQGWLTKGVGASAKLPDLSAAGFRPVGGRLFTTDSGATAAMVLYEDEAGRTLSFYLRPAESKHRLLPAGQRVDGALLARYGSVNEPTMRWSGRLEASRRKRSCRHSISRLEVAGCALGWRLVVAASAFGGAARRA